MVTVGGPVPNKKGEEEKPFKRMGRRKLFGEGKNPRKSNSKQVSPGLRHTAFPRERNKTIGS